jgi:hypothetical protein
MSLIKTVKTINYFNYLLTAELNFITIFKQYALTCILIEKQSV